VPEVPEQLRLQLRESCIGQFVAQETKESFTGVSRAGSTILRECLRTKFKTFYLGVDGRVFNLMSNNFQAFFQLGEIAFEAIITSGVNIKLTIDD
jgi:hypothetical protein